MNTIIPPYPSISLPVIDRLSHEDDEFGNRTYTTKLDEFEQSTDAIWRRVRLILAGIESMAKQLNPPYFELGIVARAEFFRGRNRDREYRRGVVLFDTSGVAIMHIKHALLGYGGAGPGLSERIMRALGVPDEMFNQANWSVAHTDYVLIFSRELLSTSDGVETRASTHEVGAWRYWRAE